MPFPLPLNVEFQKLLIRDWLQDVEDRLEDRPETAEESWKIARNLLLHLPPGEGSMELEDALMTTRVKLDKLIQKL